MRDLKYNTMIYKKIIKKNKLANEKADELSGKD